MADVNGCITLRLSAEGDNFCALDSNETESVPAGEVSYTDGKKIITRHFIWKQSRHCLLRTALKDYPLRFRDTWGCSAGKSR